MDILDLLNNDFLNLPKDRLNSEKDMAYPNFVKKKFTEYLELLLELDNFNVIDSDNYMGVKHNDFIKRLVNRLCNGINSAINQYYKGNPTKAFIEFEKVLCKSDILIENIKGYLSLSRLEDFNNLYRLRKNEEDKKYNKLDLFHVPYQSREKITTKRYSISGYPSLYLSNSIYVATKELNALSLIDISASRFRLNSNFAGPFYLLDLTTQTNFYREKYKDNSAIDGLLIRFLVTWPLIMVTSLKVNKPDKPFIPEYIIPQFVLMWIKENGDDLRGIKYSSSHIPLTNMNFQGEFYNVVIPCKDVNPSGHCSFTRRLFKMTLPISNLTEHLEREDVDFDAKYLDLNRIKTRYIDTKYSNLEKKLITMEMYDIE